MAEGPTSGRGGNDATGQCRRRRATFNQQVRRRGGAWSEVEQDGDDDHDSVLSFRSMGNNRRVIRPPSHRSMNDMEYQDYGRMEKARRGRREQQMANNVVERNLLEERFDDGIQRRNNVGVHHQEEAI